MTVTEKLDYSVGSHVDNCLSIEIILYQEILSIEIVHFKANQHKAIQILHHLTQSNRRIEMNNIGF